MLIRLKSLRLPYFLGFALLAGSLALFNSPVRADEEEPATGSAFVEAVSAASTPQVPDTGFAQSFETCVSEGGATEGCIDSAQALADAPDAAQSSPTLSEIATPDNSDQPLPQSAAAILVEITQSVTIAVPGEVAADDHEPIDLTAAPADVTAPADAAAPADATILTDAATPVDAATDADVSVTQTGAAAIVMEITQSVTVVVPGELTDNDPETVDVASAPVDNE
jgi:hypothetical protein